MSKSSWLLVVLLILNLLLNPSFNVNSAVPNNPQSNAVESSEEAEASSQEIKKYRVGVSYLNAYPLITTANIEDKGLGWAILEKFASQNNIQFEYIAMPITRLQTSMDNEVIDFIFPDNPDWVAFRSNRRPNIYSGPIFSVTSSTFVRQEHKDVSIADIKKVAIPFGYTAITWVDPIKKYDIQSIPVRDLESALQRLRQGTVDAADVEYNIGQYLMSKDARLAGLTINKNLPSLDVNYHLSSMKHILTLEKLTAFIQKESQMIEELKKQYKIKTHAEVYDSQIP